MEVFMKSIKATKKSLFITTLLIVVLLIAAVATATFAWFTAQTQVTATGAQVTASAADVPNLAIGLNAGTGPGGALNRVNPLTTVEFDNASLANIVPLAPATLSTEATTTKLTDNFYTAEIDSAGRFTRAGATALPARLVTAGISSGPHDTAVGGNAFFVANQAADGGNNFSSVTFSLTDLAVVDGDGGVPDGYNAQNVLDLVRVAIFVGGATAADSAMELKGVLARTGTLMTVVGAPVAAETAVAGTSEIASVAVDIGSLAPDTAVRVAVVVWFDGFGFTSTLSDFAVSFGLQIDAVAAQA